MEAMRSPRKSSVGQVDVARMQEMVKRMPRRSLDDECHIVLAALTLIGISEDVGRVVIDALGIENRSDLAFIRDLNPKFLMDAVELNGSDMNPVQALRVCKKLAALPNIGVRSNAGLQELLTSFGAVEHNVGNPSNQLLMDIQQQELFVPTYPILIVRRLRRLNEFQRQIDFGLTVVLRFDFCGLPPKLNELIVERLSLRLNDRSVNVRDTEHSMRWVGDDKSVLMLILRLNLEAMPFTAHDNDRSDWAHYQDFPFDRPAVNIHLELLPFMLTTGNVLEACDDSIAALDQWNIRFNLHRFVHYSTAADYKHLPVAATKYLNKNVQLVIREEANKLLNFEILRNLTTISFPVEKSSSQQGNHKTATNAYHTPSVHFTMLIFRHPGAAMRWGVLPLLALNLGTLSTLFMNDVGENYNDRLMNLVTLMVALFAFLGFARSSMPDVPASTWIDRAILRSTIMAMAVMIESLFAFLTSSSNMTMIVLGDTRHYSRGGAFHYFWSFRATFRNVIRCFGIGIPLMIIQLHTMYSLWTSYRRYVDVLNLDAEFNVVFRATILGGEKFSRRQYMHPTMCDKIFVDRRTEDTPPKTIRNVLADLLPKDHRVHPDSPTDATDDAPRPVLARQLSMQKTRKALRSVLDETREACCRDSLDSLDLEYPPSSRSSRSSRGSGDDLRKDQPSPIAVVAEANGDTLSELPTMASIAESAKAKTPPKKRRRCKFEYSLGDNPMDTLPYDS